MYTLESLTDRAEVNELQVRYFIQRGLLPPPLVTNDGNFYSDAHLERLQLLRELSEEGIPLSRLGAYLNGEKTPLSPAAGDTADTPLNSGAKTVEGDSLVRLNCFEVAPGIRLSYPEGMLSDAVCGDLAVFLAERLKLERKQ